MNPTKRAQIILFLRGYAAMFFSVVASPVLHDAGVSFQSISIAFGFLYVVLAIFEIPTGAWADVFGAKTSAIMGSFFQAASLCLLSSMGTQPVFLVLSFCLYGLGSSFVSGALTALLYAKAKNFEGDKFVSSKYFSITERAAIASYILASASVGFLSHYLGLKSFFVGSGFFFASTIIIFFAVKEEITKSANRKLDGLFNKALESFRFISGNKELKILLPVRMLNQVESILGILWLPWIKTLGGSDLWFSVMATGSYLSRFAITHYLANKNISLSRGQKITFSLTIMALGSGICAYSNSIYIALFGVWTMAGARGLFLPVTQEIQHDIFPENVRSTGLSVMNFALDVMIAISFFASSLVVDSINPKDAWLLTCVCFVVGSLFQYCNTVRISKI